MLFGKLKDKTPVHIYEIKNGACEAGFCDLGAGLAYFRCPDRDGALDDVVLKYNTPGELLLSKAYFGLTVGRYANRIAKGSFVLDGKTYTLNKNDGPNHLHGGPTGLSFCMWKAQVLQIGSNPGVKFSIDDPEGHENYPGNLNAQVTYVLLEDGSLIIKYKATVSAPCPVNLCNHAYFNLEGLSKGKNVMDTVLKINAKSYIPVDKDLIPTGEILPVEGTPFDFSLAKPIGQDGEVYDHCFVLNEDKKGLRFAAKAWSLESGRTLEVFTTMPCIQLYDGNSLHKEPFYDDNMGFCLETEFPPDSPNQKNFPSCILRPGEVYDQATVYKFSTEV